MRRRKKIVIEVDADWNEKDVLYFLLFIAYPSRHGIQSDSPPSLTVRKGSPSGVVVCGCPPETHVKRAGQQGPTGGVKPPGK